jgi:N-acetylneuraminic acid mutarotase
MKLLAGVLAAMGAIFAVGVLATADVIDLPGSWRTTLGLTEETPNSPCRLGLYRDSPASPPAPAGSWRSEPEAPKAQVEGSAVGIGDTVYTFGGSHPGNLHTVLAFDTRSRKWSEPTRLPTGLNHSQAVTYRRDLYLAGGYREGLNATADFWKYDPENRRWSQLPPMPRPRGAAAAAVIGDKLYVADGAAQTYFVDNPDAPYTELAIYDFEKGNWSSGPDAPIGLHHLSAAALGGRFYMAGGRLDAERSSSAFLRYDPATETWKRLPDLPQGAISSLGIAAAVGRIVVFGGDDELGWESGGGSVSASAWAFDPRNAEWRRLPDLGNERHAFGAAVARGRIYAIAGSICPGLKPNGPVGTHTVESLPFSKVRPEPVVVPAGD